MAIAVLVEQWVARESAIHLAATSGPVNLPAIVFTSVYLSVRLGPWEGACGLSALVMFHVSMDCWGCKLNTYLLQKPLDFHS